MSFYPIPRKAYADDRPTEKRPKMTYMKKQRLPSQFKTKNHKCSQCERKDAKKYSISEKETRWLCPNHFTHYTNHPPENRPNFIKASKLSRL